MNSIELKRQMIGMIPQGGPLPQAIYHDIINAIIHYYMNTGISYDAPQAIRSFEKFLNSGVLAF